MDIPKRKDIRLKGYNYSQGGYYYVTICTQNRRLLFGEINNKQMILNQYGNIVNNVWYSLPQHHNVILDIQQIMPNHIHFIINKPYDDYSLAQIVAYFKYQSTKKINEIVGAGSSRPQLTNGVGIPDPYKKYPKIWQRNYYEHIVRNEKEYYEIKEYIRLNPSMWERDRNNPINFQNNTNVGATLVYPECNRRVSARI